MTKESWCQQHGPRTSSEPLLKGPGTEAVVERFKNSEFLLQRNLAKAMIVAKVNKILFISLTNLRWWSYEG